MTCLRSPRYQAFMPSVKKEEVKLNTYTLVDQMTLREDYKSIKVKSSKISTREWQASLNNTKSPNSG